MKFTSQTKGGVAVKLEIDDSPRPQDGMPGAVAVVRVDGEDKGYKFWTMDALQAYLTGLKRLATDKPAG